MNESNAAGSVSSEQTASNASTSDRREGISVGEDVQASVESTPTKGRKKFGTFGGVFTPTLLTILGVIMYLREGWVIGNAGLLGGLMIIFLGFGITLCTALSMSSITTNIRIGAGGAYAVIAQSLGLEVGGSVGIPRYLSQALAVTMYIFGFREGWLAIFPGHSAMLVDAAVFVTLYGIAYVSADFAIRVQYLIMAIIAASLVSIGLAAGTGSMQYDLGEIKLWGDFATAAGDGSGFWIVFAVFFPATTGIMAGANMSGDLKEPRKAIPIGTLAAIGVAFIIYVFLAIWLAKSATPEELKTNYMVMAEKAFWSPAVLAGLLGATFSSALASFVGAGRILQAMGAHEVVPASSWLSRRADNGEPRNAMWVTGGIIVLSLLVRDLNAVAPLITMFFLVTYAMINAAVLIEQSLDLVSFRPKLRIPRWVSLLGLLGSLFAMFIINPTVSLIAVVATIAVYGWLARRHLDAPFEDVRSGMFVSVAEWAAKKVAELPTMQERAWKPNLLVPVENASDLRGTFLMLEHVTKPQGSVKIVGITDEDSDHLNQSLEPLTRAFRERGVFASHTVLDAGGFADGLSAGMQALRGAFFRPNVVFLRMPEPNREEDYRRIIREADREKVGTMLYAPHPRAALGQQQTINVWIRDRSPEWNISMDIGNLDLALLTGYKLSQNWDARLRVLTVTNDPKEEARAQEFLDTLTDLGRIPDPEIVVRSGDFRDHVRDAPQSDLSIFGLDPNIDFAFSRALVETTESTCLFVRDSGLESALA
ncbi:Na-K-Cl cotransporter [Longibacter salinarum]|uniref:Na-K-Cl cotransporter n=1 Tax=Longibacter salinarum TaxID=1850348 RepID=A0A2A8D164_9BACT|nr:amino acid permease [Longibacter salinarum]PEN14547.1 Na-K-Cl cotransporter [Longibacter salinarum]